MKQRKRLSIQEVSKLYARFESTGLSLAEFARHENIPYLRLLHYKRRLFKQPSSSSFLQLLPAPLSSKSSTSILLRCSAFELEIAEGFNPTLLSQVMEVLKHHA